jgi:CDP-6-deoxy-D-xylo-4-hexulose-3-dehydrase
VRIPLALASLTESDVSEAISVLKSGNLTMGNKVLEFENRMARYLKVDHFVMVNSGSSANLLIFEYLLRSSDRKKRLCKGDGVLVPAIAWPTTVWPIIQLGLRPVFVDVDRETFQLDLNYAQEMINLSKKPIKALFPIHPLGLCLDHELLESFRESNDLILVSDVCESLGSWRKGIHAGTSSLAASFSFYFSHHITTMEGGGICTNSLDVANDLRSMRSHGWSRNRTDAQIWTKGISAPEAKFLFVTTGYNVRPTEIQAAIGLNQITNIDSYIAKRRSLAQRALSACENSPIRLMGSEYLARESSDSHSWMMLPFAVKDSRVTRFQVQEYLEQLGVETRPVLTGNFLQQPAMTTIDELDLSGDFTNTNWVANNCFLVGAHHDYSEEQIDYLMKALRESSALISD